MIFLFFLAVFGVPPGPETVHNEAGYIGVGEGRELFYWFFESRNDPAKDPFIIWFSGGPGCSSQLALFSENGPYQVEKLTLKLKLNPYSWNSNATVLWIDQPAGSGFSKGLIPEHNETGVEDTVFTFIDKFFKTHQKYKDLDFWLFGESYAGHYVPAVAGKLLEELDKGTIKLNFKGVGIGNGLTAPGRQFAKYPEYVKQWNPVYHMVKDTEIVLMEAVLPICEPLIAGCNDFPLKNATDRILKWEVCLNAYTFCALGELMPFQESGTNVYDIRMKCPPQYPLCYDFDPVSKYLNQPDVQKALGVNKKWNDCNRLIDIEFVYGGDWMLSFDKQIKDLLAAKKEVLIYVGEFDFICNWLGNENWVLNLDWPGKSDFRKSTNTTWNVDGKYAGSYKTYGGLTLMKVANAGHLVPHDQPENALDMVNKLTGGAFS